MRWRDLIAAAELLTASPHIEDRRADAERGFLDYAVQLTEPYDRRFDDAFGALPPMLNHIPLPRYSTPLSRAAGEQDLERHR